jgi:hypothetical protein
MASGVTVRSMAKVRYEASDGPRTQIEQYEFANGAFYVHARCECDGWDCPIHSPSPHAMHEEPMVLQRESRLVLRLCRHQIAHPDPDSVVFFERCGVLGMHAHECDECCTKLRVSSCSPS